MEIVKAAQGGGSMEVSARELEAINALSRRDLKEDEVYLFCVRLCDNEVDRDGERFAPETLDSVCVTFDKLDKIGPDGVKAELTDKEYPAAAIDALDSFLREGDFSIERVASLLEDKTLPDSLLSIINTVKVLSGGKYGITYAPSLVRGQGYYTGVVFEITCAAFSGAVAGGGRYDGMIGKFLGQQVPAVGFSIGFERIFGILQEKGMGVSLEGRKKLAIVYEGSFADAYEAAEGLRAEYDCALYLKPKKVGKLLSNLEKSGFSGFAYAENIGEIRFFEQK